MGRRVLSSVAFIGAPEYSDYKHYSSSHCEHIGPSKLCITRSMSRADNQDYEMANLIGLFATA